jgi:tRNA(Ile)-lysidine synthase
MPTATAAEELQRAVESSISNVPRVVLAVSGGRDSIVLLHAAAATSPSRIAAVAVFDHRTGTAASRAVELVLRRARELGLRSAVGHYAGRRATEAAWREARWNFLRAVASRYDATIATAHTQDDQLETVLMRVLRGAGARGLAGLAPAGSVLRPLLEFSRESVAAYASRQALDWVEDPSNLSYRYVRNRVRHDLLPALSRVRPEMRNELLEIGSRAADWRVSVARAVDRFVMPEKRDGELWVARTSLAQYAPAELAVMWPEIAARAGIVLDRRGTSRLAEFTRYSRDGQRIPLSGGAEVVVHRGEMTVRRAGARTGAPRRLRDGLVLGEWVIRRIACGQAAESEEMASDPWVASLPLHSELIVRTWHAGDRMVPSGARRPRRVKRMLREAHIDAARRTGWPVVVEGDEILWVPGVRRGRAASDRHGGPNAMYRFERICS